MSRDISKGTQLLQDKFKLFSLAMAATGIPLWYPGCGRDYGFMVTSVDRSILEQIALYVQGRLDFAEVNKFRAAALLPPIQPSDNNIVTWTLNSKHVVNLFDNITENDGARAFDIVIVKGGQATWNEKVSVDGDAEPDYLEAAKTWENLGGTKAGARFKTPDLPHMELA